MRAHRGRTGRTMTPALLRGGPKIVGEPSHALYGRFALFRGVSFAERLSAGLIQRKRLNLSSGFVFSVSHDPIGDRTHGCIDAGMGRKRLQPGEGFAWLSGVDFGQ